MEFHHSTSTDAAETALKASVRRLILNHISPRYEEEDAQRAMLDAAVKIFPETSMAQDLMHVHLGYQDNEHGEEKE